MLMHRFTKVEGQKRDISRAVGVWLVCPNDIENTRSVLRLNVYYIKKI